MTTWYAIGNVQLQIHVAVFLVIGWLAAEGAAGDRDGEESHG